MSSWDGKSRSGVIGYKIFVLTLRHGGLIPAYFILLFVALYFFLFSRSSSRFSYQFFRKRIGFSRFKSIRSIYSNYFIFGQTLIDRVAVMAGLSNKFTFDFDGEEYLIQIVQEGKGGILISAHIGNWEVAGHLLYRINAKINVLIHEAEHEQVKHYLEGIKGKGNMNVIVMKDDFSHIYDISKALENGEIICLHGDRFMPWSKTMTTKFLGDDAHFPQGPFAMAVGFKVPVSYVFAMKEGIYHYHFSATPPKIYSSLARENKNRLIESALSDYIQIIEKKVEKYPIQWFNYYDFWKDNKDSSYQSSNT
jgi:predicted LPLAT superfamily acyltransferase